MPQGMNGSQVKCKRELTLRPRIVAHGTTASMRARDFESKYWGRRRSAAWRQRQGK